jgi:hypothetical protein
MKQTMDPTRAIRPDKNRLLASTVSRSRQSCTGPFKNAPIAGHPLSDGAVWMFLVILVSVVLAAGYVFWAKLNSAWPFDF